MTTTSSLLIRMDSLCGLLAMVVIIPSSLNRAHGCGVANSANLRKGSLTYSLPVIQKSDEAYGMGERPGSHSLCGNKLKGVEERIGVLEP
jgi:hypothetical protein